MEFIIIAVLLSGLVAAFFYKCVFLGLALVPADILGLFYPWKLHDAYAAFPHNYVLGDGILAYYPLIQFVADSLKSGVFPLWNPFLYFGSPILGTNDAFVMTPVSLLAYFLPVYKAYSYYIILSFICAGFFMYLFLRKGLMLDKISSLAGGCIFMFNGHFVAWAEHLGFVAVWMWLPLILLFVERMVRSGNILFSLGAGILLGSQFFFGFFQISLFLMLGIIIYCLIRFFQEGKRDKKRIFFSLFLVFVVGLSIGAIRLVPFLKLLHLSDRDPRAFIFHLLDPARLLFLLTAVVPDIFGSPARHNYIGPENYVELCLYIGLLPLILALAALGLRRDKLSFVFGALAVFSLGVYLKTPLYNLLSLVPGFHLESKMCRISGLFTFAGSVLAALGINYLERLSPPALLKIGRRLLFCFFAFLLFFLALSFIIRINKDYIIAQGARLSAEAQPTVDSYNMADTFKNSFKVLSIVFDGYVNHSERSLGLFILFGLASVVLFKNYRGKFAKAFLIAIILGDLFSAGMGFYPAVRPDLIFPPLSCVEFLKKDKSIYRVFPVGEVFLPNTLMAYGIHSIDAYLSLFQERKARFWELIDREVEGLPYRLTDYNSRLLDMLNVKYFIGIERIDELHSDKFELVYKGNKGMVVYKNGSYLERAFFVPDFIVLKNEDEILGRLAREDFDPQKLVIVEEEPEISAAGHSLAQDSPPEVNILSYSANSILIETSVPSDGFLVLSASNYPGWKAYVDGRQEKVYRANYILRAVALNKGRHQVRFVYDPLKLKIGKYISLTALLISIMAVVVFWRLGKKPQVTS